MKNIILGLFILFIIITSKIYALDSIATHSVIMDYETNDVLYSKNGNERTPPASMTKIMTSYIIFDKIKKGNISLEDKFSVSSKAYKIGGSRMFVELNSKVTVKDLLYGVIIQSGNDASIVLAENVSGSEKNFAILMNDYAKKLGMKNTNFVNSSGWPHPNHYSTMLDMAILSSAIIKDFPELYKIFSKRKFKYNNISQLNRNILLKYYEGTDGLKTGYVRESGYGIVVSTVKDKRRIIVAINGLESKKSRVEESEILLNWAFRDSKQYVLIKKGQILTQTDVWLGKSEKIDLISKEKLFSALNFDQSKDVTIKLIYDKPIIAPIVKNQEVGIIKVLIPDRDEIIIPLLANEDVKKINPLFRLIYAIKYLIFGNIVNE